MHEKHPGVQDMASETFLKISEMTKHMFVVVQKNEARPYIFDLIEQIPENMRDLAINHKVMIYNGLGYMVSSCQN
jgi:exportin-1